jgi:hypothetical protein
MADSGRPNTYNETMAQEVLRLMSEGLSLTAAMAELGYHRQTAYDWQEKYPEFSDAVKLGQGKRQLFLERRLFSADSGPVVTSSIFALKNTGTGDWRDKQELDHTSSDGSMTPQKIELVALMSEDLDDDSTYSNPS